MLRNLFVTRNLVFAGGAILAVALLALPACQSPAPAIPMDDDDIGGVVSGPDGPEAGVWVIAETRDLPTRHIKTVVTDDEGRYLVPDLPPATYDVWVRGYGLVDSAKVQAEPGDALDLTAVPAPDARAAAEYYPSQHWFSLLRVPPPDHFPGTGPGGNGISPAIETQGAWIRGVINTDGCTGCHQLGNKATREIPAAFSEFDSHVDAWDRRIKSGQAGINMDRRIDQVGRQPALAMYADWTDRIAAGEYPTTPPPRPQGVERNVVVSLWDWAEPEAYMHDLISADKRDPTVNANGPVYGAPENSADYMPVLDPGKHLASKVTLEVRDPDTPTTASTLPLMSSPYWGGEVIWGSQSNAHSFAMDSRARVWDCRAGAPAGNAGVLPGGVEPSLGAGISDSTQQPAGADVGPRGRKDHDRQHLLRDAPSEFRGRRQAVVLRERSGGCLVRHAGVRRDRRRGVGAGLDGAGARHQRQRPAGRVCRAGRAAGSGPGHPRRARPVRRRPEPDRRLDLGLDPRHAGWTGARGAGRRPQRT